MNHFGLDIGSDSIKMVWLDKDKNDWKLLVAKIGKTPSSGLQSDTDSDLLLVAEAIKKLRSEAKIAPKQVVVALPERNIFSQIVEMPKMEEGQLNQAITWEAESLIPQPIAEVNLDWEIVEEINSGKETKMKVLLVAAPKALTAKYLKVLKMADLDVVSVETEILATARCLKSLIPQGDFIFGNLGTRSFDIAIIKQGKLFLTRQMPTAGESITRALSMSLNLDYATAEEYKKTYGLSNQLEGKIFAAVEPILSVIAGEFRKAIKYFEEKQQQTIKTLVLTGGTSWMYGLTEYFAKTLNVEVQVVNPFSAIKMEPAAKELLKNTFPYFTVAVGLAMKE